MNALVEGVKRGSAWRYVAEVTLLAAAYFSAARLALMFAIPPGYATAVWPPSGIALAALLLLGARAWPGIWIGAALANFTVNASLPLALLIASGNTLEALIGAALVRRYVGIPYRFERSAGVFRFVVAAILAGAVAASVALVPLAARHSLGGVELFANWWTWWQGDVAGMILVTPLILSWCTRGSVIWTRPRILEAAAFGASFALAAALIFGGDSAFFDFYPMKFCMVLFVIWAAYRFSQREVTTVVATIVIVSLWDVAGDLGSLWPWANESLLVLLAFNVALVITGLVLCAVANERTTAMEGLERSRVELETRVQERTVELERANDALAADVAARVRAERQLRAVVDTAADAIISANADGVIISFNPAAERIFGFPAGDACGQHLTVLMPQRFQAAHRQGLQRFLETGQTSLIGRTIELTGRRRSGAEFPIEVSLACWSTDAGRFFTGILRDVTLRHAAAEALRASEERFRQMVVNVVDYAILMLDPDGRIIGWNAGAERIMGYRADEIIGQHYSRFYGHDDNAGGKPQRMLELAATEGRHQDESWHVRKNGATFRANVVITRMLDPAGKLIGFSKVTRDLTERRGFELALRERNAELEGLFEGSPDMIALLDPLGRIRRVNGRVEALFGYDREAVTSGPIATLLPERSRDDGLERYLANPPAHRQSVGLTLLGRRRDGREFPVDVMLSTVELEAGRFILGVMRDATERKRAEAALVGARASAERASAEKSMFLAKMSHEFRTPLNSLMILAQLLAENAEGNLTEKQIEYARTIFGAGTDLAMLVSDILQAARDEWGHAPAPFSLAPERMAALRDYCERTFRPVAASKGLSFTIEVGREVPAVFSTAAQQLRQILNNLLSNAFRFTSAGGVTLRVERARFGWSPGQDQLDAAAGVLAFSVVDTGIGFAPEFRAVMFQEFRREGETPGSTGLGLAISRQLVHMLGGEITAASTPGQGSTFTVFLPLIEAAAASAVLQPERAASTAPERAAPRRPAPGAG